MKTATQVLTAPPVRDPNFVQETLANGPINMNVMGNFATLTFTQVRPDAGQIFEGKLDASSVTAVVVARITRRLSIWCSLSRCLGKLSSMSFR